MLFPCFHHLPFLIVLCFPTHTVLWKDSEMRSKCIVCKGSVLRVCWYTVVQMQVKQQVCSAPSGHAKIDQHTFLSLGKEEVLLFLKPPLFFKTEVCHFPQHAVLFLRQSEQGVQKAAIVAPCLCCSVATCNCKVTNEMNKEGRIPWYLRLTAPQWKSRPQNFQDGNPALQRGNYME